VTRLSVPSRHVLHIMVVALAVGSSGCQPGETPATTYDLVLRGGTVYDGSGEPPVQADVGIRGDTIAAIGDVGEATASETLDVSGLALAPGFINMMSWANESLIEDGRSQGDLRQGITLEVMGEGSSMGPLSEEMKRRMVEQEGDIRYPIEWTTLDEYLRFLEERGVSANVASFIGAENPRAYVVGYEDREATPSELVQMEGLVRQAMEEGALGVASSLIYPPGSFASTEELIALARVAAQYDGLYASHVRDEGAGLLGALDELITIARQADIRAEVYHLKAAAVPGSTPPCPRGCRRAASPRPWSGSGTSPPDSASRRRWWRSPTPGRTCGWAPARPRTSSWSGSRPRP
jgi:N-acyl-D-amino-acid deacylase